MAKSIGDLAGPGGKIPEKRKGPRTVEGKRRTKHNAIQHGIFADHVLTAEPFRESVHSYEKLLCSLCEAIQPANALEQALVEMLAFEFLRLSRVYKADARIAPRAFERIHAALSEEKPHVLTERVAKEEEIVIVPRTLDPELLIRCHTHASREIDRILNRLERLQRTRRGQWRISKKEPAAPLSGP
jgi:hypothetical protein